MSRKCHLCEVSQDSYGTVQIAIISSFIFLTSLVIVAQRMNDFRIPPGSRVKLTFGRKVLREEIDEEVPFLSHFCIN